jgi:hypothetical protein
LTRPDQLTRRWTTLDYSSEIEFDLSVFWKWWVNGAVIQLLGLNETELSVSMPCANSTFALDFQLGLGSFN